MPGNIPDSKTIPLILKDLHTAGYVDLILVTDRGYECVRTLELCIPRKQKLITAANINQKRILEKTRELGEFGTEPPGMEWLRSEEVYCRQYELETELKGRGNSVVKSNKLRLNLYFNPRRRADALANLMNAITGQRELLEECQANGTPVYDDECRFYNYFRLERNEESHLIESFHMDEQKVNGAKETLGFFANYTLGVDYSPKRALEIYGLRDEQEKYFYSMKTRIDGDLQRNWSERVRRGARFVEFVALILISRIVHHWKTSEKLQAEFKYVFAQVIAMQKIHLIEQTGKDKFIPPFSEKQALICDEYGIDVPAGCEPKYKSLEVQSPKKRGRRKKPD